MGEDMEDGKASAYKGYGFDLVVKGASMGDYQVMRTLERGHGQMEKFVAGRLSVANWRMRGVHVRFLQEALDLRISDLAYITGMGRDEVIVCVNSGEKASGMTWAQERLLRSFAYESAHIPPGRSELLRRLGREPIGEVEALEVEWRDVE